MISVNTFTLLATLKMWQCHIFILRSTGKSTASAMVTMDHGNFTASYSEREMVGLYFLGNKEHLFD